MLSAFYKNAHRPTFTKRPGAGFGLFCFSCIFSFSCYFCISAFIFKKCLYNKLFPSHSTPIHLPFFSLPLQTHNGFFLLESFLSLFCSQSRSLIHCFSVGLYFIFIFHKHMHTSLFHAPPSLPNYIFVKWHESSSCKVVHIVCVRRRMRGLNMGHQICLLTNMLH